MIIPMFSCGCLNSKLWGSRAESTGHAFYTRLGAVGHRCWPWPSRARDLARGARGKSIHCAGLAIAAGLHSPIRPHGPNAILQIAFTVVGHSPAPALNFLARAAGAVNTPAHARITRGILGAVARPLSVNTVDVPLEVDAPVARGARIEVALPPLGYGATARCGARVIVLVLP